MIYSHFRKNIILRITLLLLCVLFTAYLLTLPRTLYIIPIILTLVCLYQIASLILYVEKNYRLLSHYLESLENNDYSVNLKHISKDKSFEALGTTLSKLSDHLKHSRIQAEEQAQFLSAVLQQSDVALLAYDRKQTIILYNRACRHLFSGELFKSLNDIKAKYPALYNAILTLASHGKTSIELKIENEPKHLMLRTAQATFRGGTIHLLALQNIYQELEQKEYDAWQKLLKVLTHEIANSITPITSLAETTEEALNHQDELNERVLSQCKKAIATIRRRGSGLLNFVENYRKVSQIPKLNIEAITITELFSHINTLMKDGLKSATLEQTITPSSLQIMADRNLIEQILINLVLNAIDACKNTHDAKIKLSADILSKGHIKISVSDNGCGIIEDIKDKLFIPFFTTKPQGSGVGLTLAKHIMHLHQGRVDVSNNENSGCTFSLIFQA